MNSIIRNIGRALYHCDFVIIGRYAGYEINVQPVILGIDLPLREKFYKHTDMRAIDYVGRNAITAQCQRRLIFDTAKEAEAAQVLLQQGKEIISFNGQACIICRHNSHLNGAMTGTVIAQPILAIIDAN